MTNLKKSKLIIPIEIHKELLNEMIKKDFKPIDMPGNQVINQIELDGTEKEVIIYLDMSGSLSGRVKAIFTPKFDLSNQKIEINDLSASLLKTGFLSKGLNWMVDSFFKDNIQNKVQEILDKQLDLLMRKYLNQTQIFPLPNQMSVEMLINNLKVLDFKFSDDKLWLELEMEGFVKLFSNPLLG